MKGLNHPNIVKLMDYGSEGTVKKKSGRVIEDLVYILMEHVSGGLLSTIFAIRSAPWAKTVDDFLCTK